MRILSPSRFKFRSFLQRECSIKPLENLMVVSLEQAIAAPYCSMRLRDAGARVIKIERKEGVNISLSIGNSR